MRAGSVAAHSSRADHGTLLAIFGPRASSYRRSSDGDAVDADRRQADAHRHGLAVLAAGAHALVELQVVADAGDPRERLRAVADQRGALDRRRDLSVLDQVGLARREHELAVRDVHLTAAERHGIETVLDRLQDLAGVVLPGEHERVGHARHRRVGVRLAPSIAGRLHAHEPGVEPVLHVAGEDAVLDQDGAPGRRTLVVDVERAAAVGDRAVVDHRDQLGGDLLAHAAGEGRGALAVEVALEPVADRLVQENPRPARPEHDRHRAGRRVDRAELERSLARRLAAEPAPALFLQVEVERHAPAAAVRADLALAALLGDGGHVEPGERPDVADCPARGRGDQHDDFFARDRGDDLLHAGIGGARLGVDLPEQVELARELGGDGRLRQGVEIVRPASARQGQVPGGRAAIGDRARLARSLFQVLERDLVGVSVAGPCPRLRPNAGALAHVARGFLDRALLENQVLVDAVLEVDIGVVDPAEQVAAEDALHEIRSDAESIRKKTLRARTDKICHWGSASRAVVRANPIARPPASQAFWTRRSYTFILPVA